MRRQQGFGAIAAVVVLVILALLSAAIVSVSTTQQITAAQDVEAARAWQAARAGNEWGLYQALQNGTCATASTLDLRNPTGFYVTVRCTAYPQALLPVYNEGESVPGTPKQVRVYRLEAIACPVAGGCPAAAASAAAPGYVERRRVVVATN